MKTLFLLSSLIVFKLTIYAQSTQDSIIDINPNDQKKYLFLDKIIENKNVVTLGEINHGDGSSFIQKTELIKYLSDKHGFNTVLIESPFAQMELMNQYYSYDSLKKIEELKKNVFSMWSKSNEMQPLFDYMQAHNTNFSGFDCQLVKNYAHIEDSVKKYYAGTFASKKESLKFLNTLKVLLDNYGTSRNVLSSSDRKHFISKIDKLINLTQLQNVNNKSNFWHQTLISIKGYALMSWETDVTKAVFTRDEYMAKNLLWLIENKYKGQKVIVWGASEHLCRNQYLLNDNKKINKYKLMGDFLYDELKNNLLMISFIYYEGETSINNFTEKEIIKRDEKSLEYTLSKSHEYAFVNAAKFKNYKVNAIDNYTVGSKDNAHWDNIFDGFYFIKTMKPSTKKL